MSAPFRSDYMNLSFVWILSTGVLVTVSELLVSCTMIIQLRFIDYSK